ncbi:hypothetical protein E4U60_002442 [Claviceps pazoutovae]|uniref:Uncharacterized protein n=1 Tax=Claviceps pazoutovae TaxID=1649127 RepID=A0A9P7SJ75_9HYPO|nr:hypothetical protein E4U60_002442 [Claviceps pazoutovae]
MVIVISLIMVSVLRRRKKSRESCDTSEAETLGSDLGATGSEKLNSLKDAFSRMSKDPFAPFGGRVDKPNYSYRPSTGTFELDGVAINAVELPATSIPEIPDTVKTAAAAPDEDSEPDTVKTAAAAPDEDSKPDTVKTAPDEASEPDTVKTAAAASDEDSEPDIVKTAAAASDEDSEPDTVKMAAAAPDEASEPDTVKTAPDEASEPDIVKTAAAASDEASEPRTAPPTPEPAATLASPSSSQGKITYVNQWNEYKALAAGQAPG